MPKIIVEPENNNVRLDRYLRRENFYFPQNLFEKWSRQGKLLINGSKAKAASRVNEGDEITFPDNAIPLPPPETTTPLDLTQEEATDILSPMIVFENEKFLVLNKTSGLATQGGTNQKTSVDDLLRAYSPDQRFRLTHRIDIETSGLLIVAKSAPVATELTNAFRDRSVEKHYLALCDGVFTQKSGVINQAIGKSRGSFERMSTEKKQMRDEGREAITAFEAIKHNAQQTLVVLSPKTGRTHQLRVHMADLGHPILGDRKYGGPPFTRLMLHAWKIQFDLFGQTFTFEAPIPKEFKIK